MSTKADPCGRTILVAAGVTVALLGVIALVLALMWVLTR
jgi:flagellar biogenesis protein FliO